jgi:hypothetical protein
MKVYGKCMYRSNISLTSALFGGEWSASRHCCFTPGERTSDNHWIEGWMGSGACLDDVEKRKLLTLRDSNFNPSVVQPVTSRYTDCAIPVACNKLIILINQYSNQTDLMLSVRVSGAA